MVVRIITRRDGALIRWLPEVFYRPDIYEKYGDTFDTPKYKKKAADSEKENTNRDLRMKHGKKWRDFTKDALAAKQKDKGLKRGEVKKLVDGKWVSNKG